MKHFEKLKHHYRPTHGWINDPNGLVYFNGYYHIFYQHSPDFETPWHQPMHWGHAVTKDLLSWQELPIALAPDREYDSNGCWSGTATVCGDTLYLFYASVQGEEKKQTVSIAYSKDGISFEKYEGNPVIHDIPADGGPDFRDPAICKIDDKFFLVMATGNKADKAGRLLLYKSNDIFNWEYVGIMSEWENCLYAECPSLVKADDDAYLLAASVCPIEHRHYFSLMYGKFKQGVFNCLKSAVIERGPDQYAGQIFRDCEGRCILISWVPGWEYSGYADRDIGCMSVPREIKLVDGKLTAYPIREYQHLLTDSDPCVERTENGFIIKRDGREPVVCECDIRELKILRDEYLVEVFVNGGEESYTAIL